MSAQSDLEAAPGRKLSPEVEIDSQTSTKPATIEKMKKSKKNTQKLQDSSIFRVEICIFALLTQQII